MIATLYPSFPLKLTGGTYASLLADTAVVRFLSTRCVLCDLTFQQCSDLFLHHSLAHGCLPPWYLSNFHVGLGCLHQHLRTLDLNPLSDRDIQQLGQTLILRIHCAQLHGHGGGGELSADDGHLARSPAQGAAQTLPGLRPSGDREAPQGQETAKAGDRREYLTTSSQSYGHLTPSSRRQSQMPEPRHGIPGPRKSRSGIDLGGTHDCLQRLDQPQGENNSIAASPGGNYDRPSPTTIHSPDRSKARQRASQEGLAVQPTGHQQPMSLSQLESGEEAIDQVQDPSIAFGGSFQADPGDANMSEGLPGNPEVPQLEEDVHGHHQSGALHVAGESQNCSKSMAPPATIGFSQFLAAHPGTSSTIQPAAQSSCQAPPTTDVEALRPFVNSNGLNCYANSSCLGLAWLSQVIGVTATAWSDNGYFKQTCFKSTLQPLNVLTCFADVMEPWLTVERQQKQHDINEFLSHLMHFLQPSFLNMTWWPKWTLQGGSTQEQNLEDRGSIARGNKWDALTLPLPTPSGDDFLTLQTLIHKWHDPLGMSHVLTTASRGLVVHINRQQDTVKDLRPVDLESLTVDLPISATCDAPIIWTRYQIQAITYHIGMEVTSGHYRTMVKTVKDSSTVAWMNYEDSSLPDRMTEPSNFQLKNLVLVWLMLDPHN